MTPLPPWDLWSGRESSFIGVGIKFWEEIVNLTKNCIKSAVREIFWMLKLLLLVRAPLAQVIKAHNAPQRKQTHSCSNNKFVTKVFFHFSTSLHSLVQRNVVVWVEVVALVELLNQEQVEVYIFVHIFSQNTMAEYIHTSVWVSYCLLFWLFSSFSAKLETMCFHLIVTKLLKHD